MTPAPNLLADAPTPTQPSAESLLREKFEYFCRNHCSPGARSSEWYWFIYKCAAADVRELDAATHASAQQAEPVACDNDENRAAVDEAYAKFHAQQAGTRVTDADVERGLHDWYRGDVWRTECTYEESDRVDMRRCLESFAATLAQPNPTHTSVPAQGDDETMRKDGCHGLDTPDRVRFYEHDFYPLSNFSAFNLEFASRVFPTSEHAYHWMKFSAWGEPSPILPKEADSVAYAIKDAESAHQAFKIAEAHKASRRPDWDDVKLDVMRRILRAKVKQHEYVRRKLLATGERELVEDSWRDDFWGWGPNRDGKNMLGKLWMEIRAELRAASNPIASSAEGKGAKTPQGNDRGSGGGT